MTLSLVLVQFQMCIKVQGITVQCITVQYISVRCNTLQNSALQCREAHLTVGLMKWPCTAGWLSPLTDFSTVHYSQMQRCLYIQCKICSVQCTWLYMTIHIYYTYILYLTIHHCRVGITWLEASDQGIVCQHWRGSHYLLLDCEAQHCNTGMYNTLRLCITAIYCIRIRTRGGIYGQI